MQRQKEPKAPGIKFDDIEANPPVKEFGYFYVVHGVIPEVTPGVAYRRVGKEPEPEKERKVLKCPHCKLRLTDTDAQTRVELYQHPIRVRVPCQFYLKCFHCGSEVGINIAG
jgi:DNA-directed RNA polymerase subunit RPC12/RpoP